MFMVTGTCEGRNVGGQAVDAGTLGSNVWYGRGSWCHPCGMTACPGSPDIPLWPCLASLKGIMFQPVVCVSGHQVRVVPGAVTLVSIPLPSPPAPKP